ncbi:hypothetical protein C5167_048397 [Papaver somniferum]|uniref:Uncharacterized protein n=1 Tax=Papaver somniferum TaxID=3469 RepID=A0A4Y7KJ87_PAPSO|nr:hypothetical protein C5167_048397 [Papaver somniferum]
MLCLNFYQLRTTYISGFEASRKWVSELDLPDSEYWNELEYLTYHIQTVCQFPPAKFIYASTFNGLFVDITISQCF